MANTVDLKSVGSLLDGKNHFFIPAYQRGYRWSRKQVEELLSDLYTFTKRNKESDGDYYCLQPVIVKPIDKKDTRWQKVFENKEVPEDTKLWELVDGQQRMTTILLILNLLKPNEGYKNWKPFSVNYESRPDFIKKIINLDINQIDKFKPKNLDEAHAYSALKIIDKWFSSDGIKLSEIFEGGEGEWESDIRDAVRKLITARSAKNIVNLIWYQLDNSTNPDTVKEFIRINNGKIPLSDSELIKALFLRHREKKGQDEKEADMKKAFSWEDIENRLQSNDFWSFISPLDNKSEDRMSLLLEMVYRNEEDLIDKKLEKGDVFRYFYKAFQGKEDKELKDALNKKWSVVIDGFHALEDWFESPLIYNYIGYLVSAGYSVSQIYKIYKSSHYLSDDNSNDSENKKEELTFEEKLEQEIKKTFSSIKIKKEVDENGKDNFKIDLDYSNANRPILERLFKFLNIHFLAEQYKNVREKSDSYINDVGVFRFPFHLYKEQGWDIEHIDSQTTNPLQSNVEKLQWLTGSLLDSLDGLSEEEKQALTEHLKKLEKKEITEVNWNILNGHVSVVLMEALKNNNLDTAIKLIEDQEGTTRDNPHCIGNLTLLDSITNRSYKNAIFCTKRKHIIDAIKKGRYVLPTAQIVFMKFFDDDTLSSSSRVKWTGEDMKKNHDFIYQQLKKYLRDAE